MNPDSQPDNLISFNHLQCLALKDRILEIEGRVVNLEEEILDHAQQLESVISEELAIVTAELEGENVINISEAGRPTDPHATDWITYGDTSNSNVFDVLDGAREKLDLLNQKIETLELPG